MPTFPVVTGDIVTSTIWNGLPAYEISIKAGTTYTLATGDEYQKLLVFTSSSAKTVSIPTDATFDFPDGTAITILNDNAAGNLTIQAVTSGTTAVTSAGAVSTAPVVGPFKAAVCLKIATNDWVIVGAVS
jgi:ABC-type polysaccharide/polyol phosphate transport system ATPase subunit